MKIRRILLVAMVIVAGAAVATRATAARPKGHYHYLTGNYFADWGMWTGILTAILVFILVTGLSANRYERRHKRR